jgi:hypothetical protein
MQRAQDMVTPATFIDIVRLIRSTKEILLAIPISYTLVTQLSTYRPKGFILEKYPNECRSK